jgi:hypothetical protein
MAPMEGVVSAWLDDVKKMRRRDDHGFVDISVMALKAALSESIFAILLLACNNDGIALGSTWASTTAQVVSADARGVGFTIPGPSR